MTEPWWRPGPPRVLLALVLTLVLAACAGGASHRASLGTPVAAPGVPAPGGADPTPTGDSSAPGAGGHGPPVPASIIEHGPRTRRWVALTFDADMTRGMRAMLRSGRVSGWYDAALFAELRATHTPATIFLTGLWTQHYPDIVRGLARDPLFELENHSLDHAGFQTPCYGLPTVSGQPSKRQEIASARATIERVAAVVPRYFRFPGGCETQADVRLVASYGERPVAWDVVSGDAFAHDPAPIVRAVLAGVHPGSIVVAHCVGAPNTPATAAAMAAIIPALRERGYRFVTLHRLLTARAPQRPG